MASRRPHAQAHPKCPYGAMSWGACDQAVREAVGRCVALTEKETECGNWGTERVNDRAYCGQHLRSILMKADEERRETTRRDELGGRIETYLAWTADHPSVWDRMNGGAGVGSNHRPPVLETSALPTELPTREVPQGEERPTYTGTPAAARTPDVASADLGSPRRTTSVLWRASEGKPLSLRLRVVDG